MEVSAPPEDARLPAPTIPILRLADETTTIRLPLPAPIQPIPSLALVATTPDGLWTAITRIFDPGGPARCRLCPPGTCCAEDNVCQIIFEGVVRREDALLISSVGVPRVRRDGLGPDRA